MKKVLSFIMTLVMLMTAAPAFAEDGGTDLSGLFGLFGNGGEGTDAAEGGNGLSGLLGLLGGGNEGEEGGLLTRLGGLLGDEEGFSFSSLLAPLLEKLRGLKNFRLSEAIAAIKQKLSQSGGLLKGLLEKITGGSVAADGAGVRKGMLGGSDGDAGTEGGDAGGLLDLLGGLAGGFSGDAEAREGGDSAGLLDLLGGLAGGSAGDAETGEGGDGAGLLDLLGGLTGGSAADGEGGDAGGLLDLLGGLMGGAYDEETGELDMDKLVEEYRKSPEYQDELARKEAVKAYLNEEYSEYEQGDEQIVSVLRVYKFPEDDPNLLFGYFNLNNYAADGKDLTLVSYAGSVKLLTLGKQEDGTFKVVEAVSAANAENTDDILAGMCDAYGVPEKELMDTLIWRDWNDLFEMCEFMKEHPEYERIEYMGEMKTPEELTAICDAAFAEAEEQMLAKQNQE